MKATILRQALERHRRVLRAPNVHLLGDERATLVSSALLSGHVMRTRLPGVATALNCTVSSEVLLSMVPSAGDLVLGDDGSTLSVRCGRSRGQTPSIAEEAPVLPSRTEQAHARLSGEDLAWLRQCLPLVSLGKTEKGGSTSLEASDGELRVCTYDEIHGAFAFRESACVVSVGLVPADAVLLTSMVQQADDLAVYPTDDNRVMVRGGEDVLVLPCIEAHSRPRDAVMGSTVPHWTTTAEALNEVLNAVAVVARAKDASAVRIACDRDGGLRVHVASTSGRISRALEGKVTREHASVGCSILLLQDIVGRIPRDATVQAYLEPTDASTRLVLRTQATKTTAGVTYVMLTSSG